jgi:hypothetical protein
MPKGAPTGNTNAANAKRWKNAIEYALEKYSSSKVKQGQALRAIAHKLVENAIDGDKDAWMEIGNRLDGKVSQPIANEQGETFVVTIAKKFDGV